MNKKFTKEEAQAKIYELTEDLIRIRQDKKDMNSGFREKIKGIEEEIQGIIDEANDTENP
jgi:predicted  nucleic acid-binding Zn-ribbon protein